MKKSRLSIIVVLALILCMILALPASAEQPVYSSNKVITVDGITYTIQIMAEPRANGSCGIMTSMRASQEVGPGYFGSQPLMYLSNGVLIATGPWDYIPSYNDIYAIFSGAGLSYYPYNLYYAVCNLHFFDTSIDGYRSYQSNRTPNFYCPSLSRSVSMEEDEQVFNINVNEHGMTYGSYLAAGNSEAPDLIAAIATNGQAGYILRTDFEINNSLTLEQVQAGIDNVECYIPVYDSNGETVIGEFLTYKVVPKA